MRRVVLMAVAVSLVACSGGSSAPPGSVAPPANASEEAVYFFNHRAQLKAATPDLAGALRIGLASFSQPSGRGVGKGEPSLTLDLSITYQGQGPEIVLLDVIPWKLGDIEKGPGARFTKVARYGLSIKPGERASVEIPLVVDKVGTLPSTTQPAGGGQPLPATTAGPSAPPHSEIGGGAGRVHVAGQQQPEPTPEPTPSPSQLPVPHPSASVIGPAPPPSPGGPFDPAAGIQVILVGGYVGAGLTADSYKAVKLVPDAEFGATYGAYSRIEQGIPVPAERLL